MHTWKKPCSTWDQPWRRCRRRCVTPSSRFYWAAWSILVRDDEGHVAEILWVGHPIIRVLKGIGDSNIEIILSIGRLSCFCSTDLYPLPSRFVSILMGSTWQFSLCRCAIYTFFRFLSGLFCDPEVKWELVHVLTQLTLAAAILWVVVIGCEISAKR